MTVVVSTAFFACSPENQLKTNWTMGSPGHKQTAVCVVLTCSCVLQWQVWIIMVQQIVVISEKTIMVYLFFFIFLMIRKGIRTFTELRCVISVWLQLLLNYHLSSQSALRAVLAHQSYSHSLTFDNWSNNIKPCFEELLYTENRELMSWLNL
jgi:hypothetical protein